MFKSKWVPSSSVVSALWTFSSIQQPVFKMFHFAAKRGRVYTENIILDWKNTFNITAMKVTWLMSDLLWTGLLRESFSLWIRCPRPVNGWFWNFLKSGKNICILWKKTFINLNSNKININHFIIHVFFLFLFFIFF